MDPKAEIIAVGSEMLTPDRVDTNSLLVTERLNEAGFRVQRKSIVGDSEADISALLREALDRSDLIVVIGGLGPTEDDVTRPAVAAALRRTLTIRPEILAALQARFAQRGHSMTRNNERQAQVVEGAEVLENAVGTAPGMWLEAGGRHIALLPGPPHELRLMMDNQVLPRARRLAGGRRLHTRSIRVAGMTESAVDAQVAAIYGQYPRIQTTVLAPVGYIAIRLQQWLAPDESPDSLQELCDRIRRAVGRILREQGKTLALAESCTSGMIGMHLTRVPGSSDYFLGGIMCYSNRIKSELCGVPDEMLASCGAVSSQVAEALACGVRRALGSSVGLAVTGIAGPGGGTTEKPVGLVYAAIADGSGTRHARRIIPGDRRMVRERAATWALSLLRDHLLGLQENPGR